MRFKTGALGICVIIIAISATLLGSWVMSMDVNENEVTKYKALTEITGEFDSEQTPTFTDYSPSTNYTGYYTDETIIDGQTYFGGVDYTQSDRANNFRLNLPPEELARNTYDLLQISEYDSDYRYVWYADYNAMDGFYLKRNNDSQNSNGGHTISLADLVETINTGHDYDSIKLSSTDGLVFSNPYGQNVSVDWCVFTTISEWGTYRDSYNTMFLASSSAMAHPTAAYDGRLVLPKLSAVVNLEFNQVILYYDNQYQNQAGIYTLDDVLITCAGGEPTATTPAGYIAFGSTINYVAQNLPSATYMDPSKGVELE